MGTHSDAIQVLVAIAAFVTIAVALGKVVRGIMGAVLRGRGAAQAPTKDV